MKHENNCQLHYTKIPTIYNLTTDKVEDFEMILKTDQNIILWQKILRYMNEELEIIIRYFR
jgi:hypothetical protein